MPKKTIWNRFGSWLRPGHHPGQVNEVVQHDAEGAIIGPGDIQNMAEEAPLSTLELRRERQLLAMEENFTRLVDVLESMNENVIEQRKHSAELNSRMEFVVDTLSSLPDSTESQVVALKGMAEALQNQSQLHQRVAESLDSLPEQNIAQIEKLNEITQNLESSIVVQNRQADSLNNFDNSVQGMLDNSKAQTISMANIGKMLEDNEVHLQNMIVKQNTRFGWLMGVMAMLGIAAVAAIAVIVWMLVKQK
ncbi:MAG: hypothetical protein K9M57_07475 [Phycisphaerae bacterium]|nr:hypothetical protein [Phycisphaerae bacterium]